MSPDRLPPGHIHASDLEDSHVGRIITVNGHTGPLVAYRHLDDVRTDVFVDGVLLHLPAGRPVALADA